MASLELEFGVLCGRCKAELVVTDQDNASKYRGASVRVEPCEACLHDAQQEGDSVGYDRGFEEGVKKAVEEAA